MSKSKFALLDPGQQNYHQPTRVFLELCRLYEKNDKSFYDVLDSLVDIFNEDQLNQVEDILVNQFGEA